MIKIFTVFLLFLFSSTAYAQRGSSDQGGRLLFGLLAVGVAFIFCGIVGEKIVGKGEDMSLTLFAGFLAIAVFFAFLSLFM